MTPNCTSIGPLGGIRLSEADATYVISGVVFLLNQNAKAKEFGLWRGVTGSRESDYGPWGNSHAMWTLVSTLDKRQLEQAFVAIAADAPDEATGGVRIAHVERGLRRSSTLRHPTEIAMAELLEVWLQLGGFAVFDPAPSDAPCAWCWTVADIERWRSPKHMLCLGRDVWRIPSVVPYALRRNLPRDLRRRCDYFGPRLSNAGLPWRADWAVLGKMRPVAPGNSRGGTGFNDEASAERDLLHYLMTHYPEVSAAILTTPACRAAAGENWSRSAED
jgi:hypothetical protein